MTIQNIKKQAQRVAGLLRQKSIKEAFDILKTMIAESGQGDLSNMLEQLETTYKFMLQYTIEGINDPERQSIYMKLIADTYSLLDKTVATLKERYSSDWVTSKKKVVNGKTEPLQFVSEITDYQIREELLELISAAPSANSQTDNSYLDVLTDLFDYLWLSDTYKDKEQSTVTEIIESEEITVFEKSLVTSAITLGLLRSFDVAKFELLFTLYDQDQGEIKMRALTGILLNLFKHSSRLNVFPELKQRFSLLSDDKEFLQLSEIVMLQFLKSKETEKITRKFQEDILPEIARISPNLREKLDLDNLLSQNLYDEDKNPDWQDLLGEVPGLTEKLEEFSELQMDGADVFMGTFAMLKQFPFFNRFINWFVPFSTRHPEINESLQGVFNSKFIESISGSSFLCNSDKYSFCLSIQQIPQDYKDMLSNAVNAELGELENLQKEDAILDNKKQLAFISNQYIQDLYRFFKLHPQKGNFEDVFNWDLMTFKNREISDIFDNSDLFSKIASFYFSKNYFEEALRIYLESGSDSSAELCQKIGFCFQKTGDIDNALAFYLKADLINSGNHWTLKKIGFCYRHNKMPDKALEYYRQAEILKPDNLSTQISIGHCYLELNNYEEALKCYFQVEYLAPENYKIWRPIAWCSFVEGKLEQAEKYYYKILENEPTHFDIMNAGHVKWAQKQPKEALELYKRSILSDNKNMSRFTENVDSDKIHLFKNGVAEADVPIMIDRLKYDLFS